MRKLYQFFTYFFYPFILICIKKRTKKGKEDQKRIQERFGFPSLKRPRGPLVWIHGASVGEALSCLILVKQLKEQMPSLHCLLTTGTVSSSGVMGAYMDEKLFHQFIPLDIPSFARRFLEYWNPQMILWFESDLWPNMLYEISQRNVACYLMNARLSKSSYKKWLLCRRFFRQVISCFDKVYAQSIDQKKYFDSLGAQNVHILGNLKFCAQPLSYDTRQFQALKHSTLDKIVWLAASTHEGEEEIVIKTHLMLRKHFPHILTFIAPRHPARSLEIESLARKHLLCCHTRTKNTLPQKETEVFVCDTLGEMGLFYALSPMVFLGGSLVPIGGHNIIEPGHFDCALLHGPYGDNFQETTDLFMQNKAFILVHSAQEIFSAIRMWVENPELLHQQRLLPRQVIKKHQAMIKSTLSNVIKDIKCYVFSS